MADGRKTSTSTERPTLAALTRSAGEELPPLPSFEEVCCGGERWFAELGYTYWNRELLEALCARLTREGNLPWLELAAGTGRWAAELGRRGLEVTATDDFSQAPDRTRSHQRAIRYGAWVQPFPAREAMARFRPEGVLCAWTPLGSCLVPDLLYRSVSGSERLRTLVCIGDPDGATEAPLDPGEIPPGWHLESWPECERYLVGFNDPLPAGPTFRSHAVLLIYRC